METRGWGARATWNDVASADAQQVLEVWGPCDGSMAVPATPVDYDEEAWESVQCAF